MFPCKLAAAEVKTHTLPAVVTMAKVFKVPNKVATSVGATPEGNLKFVSPPVGVAIFWKLVPVVKDASNKKPSLPQANNPVVVSTTNCSELVPPLPPIVAFKGVPVKAG